MSKYISISLYLYVCVSNHGRGCGLLRGTRPRVSRPGLTPALSDQLPLRVRVRALCILTVCVYSCVSYPPPPPLPFADVPPRHHPKKWRRCFSLLFERALPDHVSIYPYIDVYIHRCVCMISYPTHLLLPPFSDIPPRHHPKKWWRGLSLLLKRSLSHSRAHAGRSAPVGTAKTSGYAATESNFTRARVSVEAGAFD